MYKYIEKLGEGDVGDVWKVLKDGKIIALKRTYLFGEQMKESALKQAKFLKEISKNCIPSLVCFYDYHLDKNILYSEMEYVKGINLIEFAKKIKATKPEKLEEYLLSIIKDITKALKYLHDNGIIHQNVKPENILIDVNNQPKLVDIGISCKAKEKCVVFDKKTRCCKSSSRKSYFSAPETLIKDESYFNSDIFSLAMSIYFAAKGKYIYDTYPKNVEELKKFYEDNIFLLLDIDNIDLYTLLVDMFQFNFENRISANGILEKKKRYNYKEDEDDKMVINTYYKNLPKIKNRFKYVGTYGIYDGLVHHWVERDNKRSSYRVNSVNY